MRSRRPLLTAALALSAPLLTTTDARADDPLSLATIDFATLELGGGAIGATAGQEPVAAELTAGFVGVRMQFAALGLSGLTFRAQPRLGQSTAMLSGALLSLDEMMFGSRYPDMAVCPGFPTVRCDEDTGYIGVGATLLSVAGDTNSGRVGLRVGELDVVGSVTPAFGPTYKHTRFLPKAGASIDWLSRTTGDDSSAWVGRLMAGFDAALTLGPIVLEPTFRYRPSTAAFVDDFALEPRLAVYTKQSWPGWHDRDALRIGIELGYSYWSAPDTAFGAERVVGAEHSLFARFVLAPTIFTFGPP